MPGGFHRASPFNTSRSYRPVPGYGPLPNQICLIGEKPGRDECRQSRPFVGISGKYLSIFMDVAGIPLDSVFRTNCTFQFTEYSKPTREELERDKPQLMAEIEACQPRIIGLIGTYAVEHVLGLEKADLGKCHGVPRRVGGLFGEELGWEMERDGGYIILPMLHPANAIYSPDQMPDILEDVLQLGRLNDGEIDVVVDEWAGREDYRIVNANDLDELLPW